MPIDYDRMIEALDKAHKSVKDAAEEFSGAKKLAQLETYILGHFRAAEAVLEKARDAVQQTRALKDKAPPAAEEKKP